MTKNIWEFDGNFPMEAGHISMAYPDCMNLAKRFIRPKLVKLNITQLQKAINRWSHKRSRNIFHVQGNIRLG